MGNSQLQDLKLAPMAIGSLPHDNVNSAMELVKRNFSEIPFPPQLANISKNEDMIIQLLEGMPSFCVQTPFDFVFDTENETFFNALEEFFIDYEEICADINSPRLEKYAISKNFSHSFPYFEKIIKETKPAYAKSQITGAFTFATSLNNSDGRCAIYDETLREIIVKHLSLKALWMIKRIKQANPVTVPVIFMDEPSMSQLGTSAYLTVSEKDVCNMIGEISNIIQKSGGLSAIHCCGKCDWRVAIKAGINIINFDAYSFYDNFAIYHKEVKNFLNEGGKIAWGLVPTLDGEILNKLTAENLADKFIKSVKYLTEKGIDEKLITDNSIITSSCGAGSLTEEQAQKAMNLVFELSKKLRERF